MTILTDESRKARKPHGCDSCDRTIRPGEQYHYQFTGGTSPEAGVWRWCTHCLWAIDYLVRVDDLDPNEGIDVHEGLRELALASSGPGWLKQARLYAWLRRRWLRADGTPIPLDLIKEIAPC